MWSGPGFQGAGCRQNATHCQIKRRALQKRRVKVKEENRFETSLEVAVTRTTRLTAPFLVVHVSFNTSYPADDSASSIDSLFQNYGGPQQAIQKWAERSRVAAGGAGTGKADKEPGKEKEARVAACVVSGCLQ